MIELLIGALAAFMIICAVFLLEYLIRDDDSRGGMT